MRKVDGGLRAAVLFFGDRIIIEVMRYFALLVLCAVANAQELPQGKGKELVEKICSVCHATDLVASTRATRKVWEGTVEEMYGRGATSTEAEKAQILDYLSKYLAK